MQMNSVYYLTLSPACPLSPAFKRHRVLWLDFSSKVHCEQKLGPSTEIWVQGQNDPLLGQVCQKMTTKLFQIISYHDVLPPLSELFILLKNLISMKYFIAIVS